MTKKITLWLFVIILGITFGAGLYEARIVVPEWINTTEAIWNADAANNSNTGLRFWVFVTSIPLTLLTILSIVFALKSQGELRKWWGIATIATLVDRIMTFAYFVPAMISLMEYGNSSEEEIVHSAMFWADFNYVRIAFVFIAWLAAMKAFAAFYEEKLQPHLASRGQN